MLPLRRTLRAFAPRTRRGGGPQAAFGALARHEFERSSARRSDDTPSQLETAVARRAGSESRGGPERGAPAPEQAPDSRGASGTIGHVLYVGAVLPKLSETFVTRELLGLRRRGVRVSAASVRPPERGLDDPALDALANEARVVYGPGLFRGALRGALRSPRTLVRGVVDSVIGQDVPLARRPRILYQCLGGLALADQVRGEGVEHVHAHMANTPAGVAMYAAGALGVPFSFTGHAADLFRDRVLLPRKLSAAAFVACISEWHRSFYREQARLGDERLPVVRCGVDVADSTVADDERSGIVAVGRLVPKKGFDVLLEAVALLPAELRPRVTLVGDGPERDALERQATSLGVSGQVAFRGAAPNAEVRELLKRALVCVLPCRVSGDGDRDGIPVVLMEAMAAGTAVVSGDLPTIRELVRDGDTGRMVPPGDAPGLAAALRELLERPDYRRRLAAAGRERVLEEFALDLNLDRLLDAFARAKSLPGDRG